MDDIVEALEDLGLPVEQLHGESAPGQFEVVTTHDEALQVRLLLAREGRLHRPHAQFSAILISVVEHGHNHTIPQGE